jgi:hypothetical protein
MQNARKLADACISLALETENASDRERLLMMAKKWVEVAEDVEDGAMHNEAVERMWWRLAANGLVAKPQKPENAALAARPAIRSK